MRRISNPKYVTFGPIESVVMFATDRGQLRTNDTGEFFFREMTDGRFTCASPDLERQLIDAGVRAGQPIGITRKTYNRCAIWTVRPIGQVTEMPSPVPASTTRKPKENTHQLPERLYAQSESPRVALVASSDGKLIAAPAEPPAPVWDGIAVVAHDSIAANGVEPEGATPSAANQTPMANRVHHTEPITPADSPTLIMRCMVAAIDAAAKATAHGQEIGFPVTFGPGEIERIAVTLYINSAQAAPPRFSKPNGQARSHYNGTAGARA